MSSELQSKEPNENLDEDDDEEKSSSSSSSSRSHYSSENASQDLDDLDNGRNTPPETTVAKPHVKTYWDRVVAYWKQYTNPYVWTSTPVCVAIGIAFWCLHYIPNYEKCMLSQSIFAIIGGVIVGAFPQVQVFIKHPKVSPGIGFSKATFMQIAVILYGFRVKLDDIATVGWAGAISAILMVVLTFLLSCGLGTLFKSPSTSYGIIGCGFSICGIAAILSAAGIFESSGAEISLACIFVIIGGFLDIIIYPSLYTIKEKLGFTDQTFGMTAGNSIKEIAHTVSVGLSCSPEVSKFSMIVKMFKVFCLPFLLIVLGFVMPAIRKMQEKKKQQQTSQALVDNEEETAYSKCTEFWGKVSVPYFAFIFILMTIVNSYTNISQKAHDILNEVIIVSLSTSMFCVGVTTDLRELAHGANWRPFVIALILYVWVFGFGWLMEYVTRKI